MCGKGLYRSGLLCVVKGFIGLDYCVLITVEVCIINGVNFGEGIAAGSKHPSSFSKDEPFESVWGVA